MNGVRAGIGRVVAALAALVLSGCAGSGVAPSAGPSGTGGPSSAAASPALSPSTAAGGWAVPAEFLQVDGGPGQRLQDVVSMSMYDHACAVRRGGSLVCWGRNDSGQVGDGTTTLRTVPVVVAGLPAVVAVAAGDAHTCAVTADGGAVWCWGDNANGQLGDGSTTRRPRPVEVPGVRGVTALAASRANTCAVLERGDLVCWGQRLGGDAEQPSEPLPPTRVGGLGHVAAVSLGEASACALTTGVATPSGRATPSAARVPSTSGAPSADPSGKSGGPGGTVHCWGDNSLGALGDGTTASRAAPRPVVGLPRVVALDGRDQHMCALDTTGATWCWGWHEENWPDGEVEYTVRRVPAALPPGPAGGPATALAVGAFHVCALRVGGTVDCWATNENGEGGDGGGDVSALPEENAPAWKFDPTHVLGVSGATALASGNRASCAVLAAGEGLAAGEVRCWGSNRFGLLGNGATDVQRTPVEVPGLVDAVQVVAGTSETCARLADGTVQCWNAGAEAVDGEGGRRHFWPLPVPGLTDVRELAAGSFHMCARLGTGGVRCWGTGREGILGDGWTLDRREPVDVVGLTDATALTMLQENGSRWPASCAVTGEGLQCWGQAIGSTTPVLQGGLTTATALAGRDDVVCGLFPGGRVRCSDIVDSDDVAWPGSLPATSPAEVAPLDFGTGFTALVHGSRGFCALTERGGVTCWALERREEEQWLLTPRTYPLPTAADGTGTKATAVATGWWTSCAVLDDGGVACWGEDRLTGWDPFGTLGAGAPASTDRPRRVPGVTDAVSVAVGDVHVCAALRDGRVVCWGSNRDGALGVNPGWVPVAVRAAA